MGTLKIIIYILLCVTFVSAYISWIASGTEDKFKGTFTFITIGSLTFTSILVLIFLISSSSFYDNGQKDALRGIQKYEMEFTYEKVDTIIQLDDTLKLTHSDYVLRVINLRDSKAKFLGIYNDSLYFLNQKYVNHTIFIVKDTIIKLKEANNNDTDNQ